MNHQQSNLLNELVYDIISDAEDELRHQDFRRIHLDFRFTVDINKLNAVIEEIIHEIEADNELGLSFDMKLQSIK
jgi:hypothetical protein